LLEQIEDTATETEVKTEGSETEVAENKEQDQEAKEKARNRLSDRLKAQTFHRREAERKAEALQRELDEIKSKTVIKREPDPDDYSDRDKYNEDREAWKNQEREKIRSEEERKLKIKQADEDRKARLDEQQKAYIAGRAEVIKEEPKFHDYEKEIDRIVEVYDAPEIQDTILAAKKQGPKIVKYLGTNPDELEEIASASPKERIFLMGKLVAKLEAKPVKTISTAPNPTRSERGSAPRVQAPTGKAFDKSKETFPEYAARINRLR